MTETSQKEMSFSLEREEGAREGGRTLRKDVCLQDTKEYLNQRGT